MRKFTTSNLSYVIGVFVFVPFLVYLINLIFFSPNNIEDHYKEYMRNSEVLELRMPSRDSPSYVEFLTSKSITKFIGKNGKGNDVCWYMTFYSEEYQKYFNVLFFGYGGVGYIVKRLPDKVVEVTVNKDEFADPSLGTKENPIPILKIIGKEKSLRKDNGDYDTEYMNAHYTNNVIMYLGYYLSKDEFKKRFLDTTK